MRVSGSPLARGFGVVAVAGLSLLFPHGASAQLRPLDPTEWRVWEPGYSRVVGVGGGYLVDQRASLAGTEGPLVEAGNLALTWRTGRVALEAGGTVQRFFRDERTFTSPAADVRPADDGRRHDSGDYRIATVVRLTPESAPALAVLRFGARLPTTDNMVGLDRDATDFFALVGGRLRGDRVAVSGEAGVSINGTRDPDFEQSDVFAYSLLAEYAPNSSLVPRLAVVGQVDGLPGWSVRGNEDLGEVRLGLRVGRRQWVRAELVKGYATFSPSLGVIVTAGIAR